MSGHVNDHIEAVVNEGSISDGLYKYFDGGGGPIVDPSLAASFDFIGNKTLIDGISGTLEFGFTRPTIAEYFDVNGNQQFAAVDEPRFNHTGLGVSRGLMNEGFRTNIMLHSKNFTDPVWTLGTQTGNIVPNVAIGLDGVTSDASRLVDSGAGGTSDFVYLEQTRGVNSNAIYSVSYDVRLEGKTWTRIRVTGLGGTTLDTYFDLANGIIGTEHTDVIRSSMMQLGNSFYRIGVTFLNPVGNANINTRLHVSEADGNNVVPLDGNSSLIIAGSQLELGSSVSSSIITGATAVNRERDLPIESTLAWFNPLAGTVFSQVTLDNNFVDSDQILWEFYLNESFRMDHYSKLLNGNSQWESNLSGGFNTLFLVGDHYANQAIVKQAFAYQNNDIIAYIQGLPSSTGSPLTSEWIPTALRLGRRNNEGNNAYGHLEKFSFYNVRKDNTFLQDITS